MESTTRIQILNEPACFLHRGNNLYSPSNNLLIVGQSSLTTIEKENFELKTVVVRERDRFCLAIRTLDLRLHKQ